MSAAGDQRAGSPLPAACSPPWPQAGFRPQRPGRAVSRMCLDRVGPCRGAEGRLRSSPGAPTRHIRESDAGIRRQGSADRDRRPLPTLPGKPDRFFRTLIRGRPAQFPALSQRCGAPWIVSRGNVHRHDASRRTVRGARLAPPDAQQGGGDGRKGTRRTRRGRGLRGGLRAQLLAARAGELLHSPAMETLVWLRVPGDIVFALGAVLFLVFLARLEIGPRR